MADTTAYRTTTVAELAKRCSQGQCHVIDVRTPAEFREVHCIHATNEPLDTLDPRKVIRRNGSEDEPLYVICRSGSRSSRACEAFVRAGITNVVDVEGGTLAWESAGYPVKRGRKTMSLERQVRIAAGLLVLIGAVLAMTVHPYFAALSAFVGAGLMFAGITDTCGMALLLSRMPWNQVRECSLEAKPVKAASFNSP